MDPRIHWEDILMRIEIQNRTVRSDTHLQNSTNNLINRQEHRRYLMLSWLSTGAQGLRRNTVRTMVLQRVAAANPPLPPNSTRGLTPGLINPLLGRTAGNMIGWPESGRNQGRLRVGLGRGGGAAAIPALVPAPASAPSALAPPAAAPASTDSSSPTIESSGYLEEESTSDESQSSEVRLKAQKFLDVLLTSFRIFLCVLLDGDECLNPHGRRQRARVFLRRGSLAPNKVAQVRS